MKAKPVQKGTREYYINQYDTSRKNLLLMIILTAVSGFTLVFSDFYFTFSAYIPILCIELAEGYYMYEGTSQMEAVAGVMTALLAVVAVIALVAYIVCWIFSKKRAGWLIAALVMFSFDTAIMIYDIIEFGLADNMIMVILFHLWALLYLILGVSAHFKLKALPAESEHQNVSVQAESINTLFENEGDSKPLYFADMMCKSRVFVYYESGMSIVYRRVKDTNELVINDSVYDTYRATIEQPHVLSARYRGSNIEAGLDGSFSFIRINGKVVIRKLRLF